MLDDEEEDDDDVVNAVPSVSVLPADVLPLLSFSASLIAPICIEFPYQLNTILKTSTVDSIEADTTRACSIIFFIVSF